MNNEIKKQIDNFLGQKNIAIAGYSTEGNMPGNYIYDKFKKTGYNVFAVNPKLSKIGNVNCYKSVKDIAETIDGVVICTAPKATIEVIQACIDSNIPRVWIHRSFGQGSFHTEAVDLCRKNSIECIPAGCPLMFLEADFVHKCMKWILNLQGKFDQ